MNLFLIKSANPITFFLKFYFFFKIQVLLQIDQFNTIYDMNQMQLNVMQINLYVHTNAQKINTNLILFYLTEVEVFTEL